MPTPDSHVTVSGLGYQRSGGEPSIGSRQGHQPQQAFTPNFQQLQGEHPPQGLGRPSDSGYQQQPHEYHPQNHDTPSGPGYPHHDEDRSTDKCPAHGQDGYRNPGYPPGETDVSGVQNDGPRQYGSDDGDRRKGNRVTYREDSQEVNRRSTPSGWWSRVTKSSKQRRQNRHSSPADMLEGKHVKHPIRQRRVISARDRRKRKSGKVQVVNPMGMRLRRQMPGFDFVTFAELLDDDELKTFLPSQPVSPPPDYNDEEEEEEEPEVRVDDEEVDRKMEGRAQEVEEQHEEEERKESDVRVEWEDKESVEERVATDVITVDKTRPISKKSMRREFAKEEVGVMDEELVDVLCLR